MIQSLIHFYGCKDLEVTHHFYSDLLGLSLYKDQIKCHIYSLSSTAMIGFCTHIVVVHQEKSPIITFVVDDVQYMHQLMQHANLQPKDIQINKFFKLEHFFMKDPNGYTIEIQRFLED
jgi:catechol 2,3-dioxygenase-like lactoylglutathione lyase family enzyme